MSLPDPAVPGGVNETIKGQLGDGVGTENVDFCFVVEEAQFRYWTKVAEITGDGQNTPQYAMSRYLYGTVRAQGHMLKDQAFGLQHLIDTAKNPVTDFQFFLAATNRLDMTILIYDAVFNWRPTAEIVGIGLSAWMHNTTPSNIEQII